MRTSAIRRILAPLSAAALAQALLAGCASQAALDPSSSGGRGDRAAARALYAGQPAIVHATEYPVASAAEGVARGDDAWRQGKLDLAVYLYVQSLAYDASAPGPFLKIGAIHERRGNVALAAKAFEYALERDPDNAAANERLGLLDLQLQKNDAARSLLERAVALDPDRWRSHDGLGIAADRRGDFKSAIEHYDQAQALEPRSAAVLNNRGYSRYLAGDFTGAEMDFRNAIQLGSLPGTWTNLGRSLARQARYGEALEALLKENDMAHGYNVLGQVAMDGGDLPTALKYFQQAISAAPRYFEEAQENLALVKERMAHPDGNATRVARTDASVYGTYARNAVIGVVPRGNTVSVLKTENASSLISFRDATGTLLTGWVQSATLGVSGT